MLYSTSTPEAVARQEFEEGLRSRVALIAKCSRSDLGRHLADLSADLEKRGFRVSGEDLRLLHSRILPHIADGEKEKTLEALVAVLVFHGVSREVFNDFSLE